MFTIQITHQYLSQGQQEGNWTWLDLWNHLTINLKEKSIHNSKDWLGFIFSSVSPTMAGERFQIYTVKITRTRIFETFLPSLHNLILNPM